MAINNVEPTGFVRKLNRASVKTSKKTNKNGRPRCYLCNEAGHFQRHCYKNATYTKNRDAIWRQPLTKRVFHSQKWEAKGATYKGNVKLGIPQESGAPTKRGLNPKGPTENKTKKKPPVLLTISRGNNAYLKGKFGTRETKILVDTGAEQSVISHELFSQLPSSDIKDVDRDYQEVVGASGEEIKFTAEALMRFKLGHRTLWQRFWVIKNLRRHAILGSDFLQSNKAQIDFYKQTIRVGPHTFKMADGEGSLKEIHLISTQRRVVLEPNCLTVFVCRASAETPTGTYMAKFLDNTIGLRDQPGISIANAVVNVGRDRYVSLLAVNETTARRVIPARPTVTVAEAIEPRSIEVTTGPKVPTKPVTKNSKPINKKATAKNNDNKPYKVLKVAKQIRKENPP